MLGIEWIATYILLGLFVGFMAGLLGVGGGGLLVPLLAMMLASQGVATDHVVHIALGTSFACMIFSSLSSLRAHAARANVLWNIFYGLSVSIVLGAFLVTHIAASIDSVYIALFFAGFMMLIACQMFLNWQPKTSKQPVKLSGLLLMGAAIGSISALAAVGGGFLTLAYLNYKNIPLKKAIGTSAAIGLPVAMAGTLGYAMSGSSETGDDAYMLGFIYLPAFVAISFTSAVAAPYGARFAQRLPDAHLRKIFAAVCVALSIKMVFSVL